MSPLSHSRAVAWEPREGDLDLCPERNEFPRSIHRLAVALRVDEVVCLLRVRTRSRDTHGVGSAVQLDSQNAGGWR